MKQKTIFFFIVSALLALSYVLITKSNVYELWQNSAILKETIQSLGFYGPFLIVGLMMLAIIMSPLPSAPIALVSGALYGHTWGTLYVLIGSALGAVTAFFISRLLGYDVLKRRLGGKIALSWIGSQNTLMSIVFFSRLMPFISFDIVSYAAGLTALTFWRFFIATIAGIAPASFLLAHFGGELNSADGQRIAIAVLILGVFTALPIIYKAIRKRYVS